MNHSIVSRSARAVALLVAIVLALPLTAQSRQVVVIDPGHGGAEAGVTLPGVIEKDLMLEIGMILGAEFAKAGYDVVFTRTTDVAVAWPDRRAMAEEVNAVALVMLHAMGKDDTTNRGAEIYFDSDSQHSSMFVMAVANGLRELGTSVLVDPKPHPFLKSATVATAMLEIANMSNSEELLMLRDAEFQHDLGRVLVKAVEASIGPAN